MLNSSVGSSEAFMNSPFAGQEWYLALLDEDAQLAWAVVEIEGCLTKLHEEQWGFCCVGSC